MQRKRNPGRRSRYGEADPGLRLRSIRATYTAPAGRSAMARKTTKQIGTERAKRGRLDPVIAEIVRNGVIAVTEEMKTNLMRTAYNMIIYEALDFTVGLFTPDGETVSIGIGLPMFIRGMAETVKAKIRHFGPGGIRPGDIYVTNDAYITGSHLNHVTLTLPIFHKGALVGFSCCMAHWIDLVDIIRQNVRLPSRAVGDLRAQVTAVKTGERRFLQLISRYGRDEVAASI